MTLTSGRYYGSKFAFAFVNQKQLLSFKTKVKLVQTNLKLTMYIGTGAWMKRPLFWIDDVMTRFLMLKNYHVAVSQQI